MAIRESKLNQAIAAELRAERAAANVSQQQITEVTGISRSTLRRTLAGEVEVSATDLVMVASALSVDAPLLLGRAITRAGGEEAAVSDARASFGGRDSSGDELSVKRQQKAAADMTVEELEGQRSAATKDPELDTDEPDLP